VTAAAPPADPTVVRVAAAVAAVLAATLAGAWGFQILGDLAPCPLCLLQRWPYYLGAPLAATIALGAGRGAPRWTILAGLFALAALLVWSTYLGAYHAGVEYKLWAGPTDCAVSAPPTVGAAELLGAMRRARIVACDDAPWSLFGVSLAGFNALISAGLLAATASALRAAIARKP
jgi:disulfide bond formation protein DsbB